MEEFSEKMMDESRIFIGMVGALLKGRDWGYFMSEADYCGNIILEIDDRYNPKQASIELSRADQPGACFEVWEAFIGNGGVQHRAVRRQRNESSRDREENRIKARHTAGDWQELLKSLRPRYG